MTMTRFELNQLQPEPNCGNCKHWGFPDEDDWLYRKTHGILKKCMKIPLMYDAYEWVKDKDTLEFKDPSILAFAQDASDYRAELITKKEFFCNMWESQ